MCRVAAGAGGRGMGIRTGTHLEAWTEATGARTVAAMQDMSFGLGLGMCSRRCACECHARVQIFKAAT